MGLHDLQELYGSDKGISVINRAVKNEIPGGKRLYALMDDLFQRKSTSDDLSQVYDELKRIKNEMIRSITKKYKMKTDEESQNDAGKE